MSSLLTVGVVHSWLLPLHWRLSSFDVPLPLPIFHPSFFPPSLAAFLCRVPITPPLSCYVKVPPIPRFRKDYEAVLISAIFYKPV